MQRAPVQFARNMLRRQRRFSVWVYLTNAHLSYAFTQEVLPEAVVAGPLVIKYDGTGLFDGTYLYGGDVPGADIRYAALADVGSFMEGSRVSAGDSLLGAMQEIDSLSIVIRNTKDGDGYHLVSRILANENLLSARVEVRGWFPGDGADQVSRFKRYVVDAYSLTRKECRLSLIGA